MKAKMPSLLAVTLAVSLFTSTAPLGAQTCTAPPAGLVAWWSGDGHFFDLVGANHGAPSGGTGFATGKVGASLNFDGVSSYVHVTNTADMDFGAGDFTIEGWLYFNSLEGNQEILHKVVGVVPNDQTYFLEYSVPNSLRFMVRQGEDNQNDLTVPTSLVVGQWYHVAAVRSGNTNLLLLNGSPIGSQVAGNSANTGQGGIARIGNIAPNGVAGLTRFFSGRIDELSLYNRALTTNEIAALYTAGSAGKCKPPFPAPAGLVSWWPGENSARDVIGSNHTTPNGAVGYAPGLVGQAFETKGGYFEAPWSPSLYCNWGETGMSVEGWIFPYDINLPFHVCGMRNDSYGESRWQIAYDGEWVPPPIGVWTHVALTIGVSAIPGKATFRYYENGVVKQATDDWLWGSGPNLHCTLRIGTSQDWAPFHGLIDELSYYDRVLTTNEVAAIYAAGSAGKALPPTLAVSVGSGGVLLSWPASAAGFGLVSRYDLAPGTWEAVTNVPSLNGARKEVLLPAGSAQRFFRLRSGN